MRVYIQIKQLGKRKCSIEKIPIDFPVPPVNVQGLIEAIVSWQVCEYNERLQQSEVLKYLTQEEVSSWMIRKPETYPLPSNLKKNLP